MEDQDRITAYLLGEMTQGEAKDFEKLLERDPSLQADMEAYKQALEAMGDWTLAEAPGVERVEDLPVPGLAAGRESSLGRGENRRVPWWFPLPFSAARAFQGAVATAIFVLGFLIGQQAGMNDSPVSPSLSETGGDNGASVESISPEEPPMPKEAAQPTAAPRPNDARLARFEPGTHVRDEKGRIVFETKMSGTGAQAVWVVDGSFSVDGATER